MEAGSADDSTGSPAAWIAQVDASLSSLSSLFAPTFGGVGSGCSLIVDGVGAVLMGGSGMAAAETAMANARHAARQSAAPMPALAAQMLLKALREHEAVTGDGCSAAALATAGMWAQIRKEVGGAAGSAHAASAMEQATRRSRVRILRGLQQLRAHWIDSLALRDWIREGSGRSTSIACSDAQAIDAAALTLVRTQLSSSLTAAAAATLSRACIELLSSCRRAPAHALAHITDQLLQDDGRCIVQCATLPLADTRVMHGLLVSGTRWARPDMHSLLPEELPRIRTLCLLGPLPPSAGEATVESRSSHDALSFLQSREREAERWVERMKKEGIRLLLTTRALQPSVLAALVGAGIAAVQSMDEDDLRRVAAYAGTRAVSSLSSFTLRDDSSVAIAAADPLPCGSFAAVVQVRVGADNMMHFEVDDSAPLSSSAASAFSSSSPPQPLSIRPHTLLLCAASQGMCKQYAGMMMRALRMLRCWSRDIDDSSTAVAATAAASAAPAASSSASSLSVVGGGCAVELALMLFCEDASRSIELGTVLQHPLLPPPLQQLASSTAAAAPGTEAGAAFPPPPSSNRSLTADLPGALRAVSAGLSCVVQCLLSNALPAASSGAAAGVERAQMLPWIKMQPPLRVLLHEATGAKNLGFVYAREGVAASYTPLHLRAAATSVASECASARIQRQLRVARAESALTSLLPPLISVQDTSFIASASTSVAAAAAAASAPSSASFLPLDSAASKVALLSFSLQQVITLLRIDGSASVRSGRSGAGGFVGGGPAPKQRGRVRPARSAADEGEEDSDAEQSEEAESDAED